VIYLKSWKIGGDMPAILLIDDEQMILKMLKMGLEAYGFQVAIAASGEEGIDKFTNDHFDIVITDMEMPGMGGRGVVRNIRKSDRYGTPIIGVSGNPQLLEGTDFNTTFPKPLSIQALVESVNSLASKSVEAVAAGN
jgi:DNA-binding response OmpR family regulator